MGQVRYPVEIIWRDSVVGSRNWVAEDEVEELLPIIHTYGIIIRRSGDSIVVAQSWGEGAVLGTITIPKKAIVKMIKLKREES